MTLIDLGPWECAGQTAITTHDQHAAAPVYCKECHRPLTDPASVARKIGPVCWRTIHSIPAQAAPRRSHSETDPGQLTLNIPASVPAMSGDEYAI